VGGLEVLFFSGGVGIKQAARRQVEQPSRSGAKGARSSEGMAKQ